MSGIPRVGSSLDSRKRWLTLMVLCLGVLMIVLDTTIVNVALPSIRADLKFSETSLVWVVDAGYRQAFTVGALFAAAAGVIGAVWLRTASPSAAASPSSSPTPSS